MSSFSRWAAVMLIALVSACGGGGEGWLRYPLWVPTDLKLSDLDGNGLADIVSISQKSSSMTERVGQLAVRLQTSPGVFAPAQTYAVGVYPWRLQVADIDGDGAPDLIVSDVEHPAGASRGGGIWLLTQSATRGKFIPAQLVTTTTYTPYDVAVGDLNGDGAPDVVIPAGSGAVTGAALLLQDPAQRGHFLEPVALSVPGTATTVAIGDLDGDGRSDIVFRTVLAVAQGSSTSVLGVLLQRADGSFAPWSELPSPATGLNSQLLELRDMNGDGRMDVVEYLTPCCDASLTQVRSLVQSPAGGAFTRVDTSLAGIHGANGGVFADLDGDGRIDMGLAGTSQFGLPDTRRSTAHVLLQDATGQLRLTQDIELMPLQVEQIAAGDLNGDGRPDLVVLSDANRVGLLYQSAAQPGTYALVQTLE